MGKSTLQYIAMDMGPNSRIYNSAENKINKLKKGDRTTFRDYINENNIVPISIHESHLPEKVQLIAWFVHTT